MRIKHDQYFYNHVDKLINNRTVTTRNQNLAFELRRYARSRDWLVTFKWDVFGNFTLEMN